MTPRASCSTSPTCGSPLMVASGSKCSVRLADRHGEREPEGGHLDRVAVRVHQSRRRWIEQGFADSGSRGRESRCRRPRGPDLPRGRLARFATPPPACPRRDRRYLQALAWCAHPPAFPVLAPGAVTRAGGRHAVPGPPTSHGTARPAPRPPGSGNPQPTSPAEIPRGQGGWDYRALPRVIPKPRHVPSASPPCK